MIDYEPSSVEITDQPNHMDEEEDPFLKFIDYAQLILKETENDNSDGPGWSWIASRILKACVAYSSGVTPAILLSDLSQAWNEQNRGRAPKKRPECINQLKEKHRRAKLPSTVTIDSIYEKRFLSLTSVIEAVIIDAYCLPGTNICMITLGDFWSSNTIDLYLHRRFYKLADPNNGILKKGREAFLTGCHLRTASKSCGQDQDDDAMLIGAQFCSDSFSSISLEAVKEEVSYSLYARIESIGSLETQKYGNLQKKQITLVDNDGVKLKFLLWGEQVMLSNLFSVGSMLALDRPFIASSSNGEIETCEEIFLEYGSATQLFMVPSIQHEERVSVSLTQSRSQGSKLLNLSDQRSVISQVTLPCDSQGSIDFSLCPFRSFVVDLRDKMTGLSLYGVVADIVHERNTARTTFSLKLKDITGTIWIKLYFVGSWSLGRLGLGHTVYISGLTSSTSRGNRIISSCFCCMLDGLQLSWLESDIGASFINISCLPALLNSSCLHKLSRLSDLSIRIGVTHILICRIWLDQIEYCHVSTRFSHSLCGNFVDEALGGDLFCNFCNWNCSAEVVRSFHLKITLADESAKVFAWCTGQTAAELLQISLDDFDELSEEEQILYPSSLENERFIVAIVSCRSDDGGLINAEHEKTAWEVTRATTV
ncbi:uncharacterized protein LOC113765288 isoform X3 [Coffea eugenioides]|uniref:uncharacterized protein LOC113765288 isoform X3 n=1 Tax=Coffea eugenioides TaxID=49369 RepID=UPI000F61229B|nr:uncharacterized protein LOC113765288 isoform X3 [Coffea eugenioides]